MNKTKIASSLAYGSVAHNDRQNVIAKALLFAGRRSNLCFGQPYEDHHYCYPSGGSGYSPPSLVRNSPNADIVLHFSSLPYRLDRFGVDRSSM